MYIEKNSYDTNYPYTIYGGWGDRVCASEEDLAELKEEIERILYGINK